MIDSHLSRRSVLTAAAVAGVAIAPAVAQDNQAKSGLPGSGKAALVTGSSRGIGAAVARRLAEDGYAVTVNYLKSRDLAEAVVKDIEAAGGRAIAHQADVADPAAVKALFDANDEAWKVVDVVVNNAGIMNLASFAEMTDEQFDRMIATNLKGGFNVLREAARRIRENGTIVSLSSSITQLQTEKYGPYAATKSAQEMYSGALARELGARKVSVNAIAPGFVNTTLFTDGKTEEQIQQFIQRTPFKRLGEPEDIANVVAGLASRDSHWITGQVVFANGGAVSG